MTARDVSVSRLWAVREAQARQRAACVPSMFSSSEVKVFYPT